MVGLVFAEELRLTHSQWLALALNAAAWLWHSRHAESYRRTALSGPIAPCQGLNPRQGWRDPSKQFLLTALLSFSALWVAFWNTPTSIDQQMLFEQAGYLGRYHWPEFLEALASRPYVSYQPPFVTFWISRLPVFWAQQLLFFPFALLCAGLMQQLYGRPAALLCATPVFALMIHQPCNDTLLFGCLLIVLRLLQLAHAYSRSYAPRRNARPDALRSFDAKRRDRRARRSASSRAHIPPGSPLEKGGEVEKLPLSFQERGPGGELMYRLLAAVAYGLSWLVKPLTILTSPFLLPQLGLAGLGSLGIWAGYILWSRRWEFGRRQFAFLLHQLALKPMTRPGRHRLRPPSPRSSSTQRWRRLLGTLRWRWEHLGHRALLALPFSLFPAWLRPWTWKGLLLAAIIIFGYGNSKYLLLDLLFLFPVQKGFQT